MKIIIKTYRGFPEDLACNLASEIVGDGNEHSMYTWNSSINSKTKIYASKDINKNGTIIIGFWDNDGRGNKGRR